MRIDALNNISQIYGSTSVTHVNRKEKTSGSDKLEISNLGRDLQIAKQAVSAAPDIREDKVAEYKNRIASGTYEVTGESFAEKLLAKYGEFM